MMVLEDIDNILIKLQYNVGILNTSLTNIEMDSAAAPNSGLGAASYVEECSCPVGYAGYSCEVRNRIIVNSRSLNWDLFHRYTLKNFIFAYLSALNLPNLNKFMSYFFTSFVNKS